MIDVGELRVKATGLRRFLLFQSLPQFLSWAALMACGFGLAETAIWLGGLRHSIPVGAIAGGIGGSLPSLWLSRQVSFRVQGPGRAEAWNVAERSIAPRYRPPVREGGVQVYRPKLPRWLRWDEQDVRMSMDRDGMLVAGPYGVVLELRRLLAVTFSD
jgi:hypothetical protein